MSIRKQLHHGGVKNLFEPESQLLMAYALLSGGTRERAWNLMKQNTTTRSRFLDNSARSYIIHANIGANGQIPSWFSEQFHFDCKMGLLPGAMDYLKKPVRKEILLLRVKGPG